MSVRILFTILTMSFLLSSCGWIKSLRREVSEEDQTTEEDLAYSDDNDRRNPETRRLPPPVGLTDEKSAALAGSSLDYSGMRAKNVRVKANDFYDENARNENSLWSEEGQNNYLFARNKLKNPGDLVTVIIEDGLRNDMIGSVRKLLPPEYRDSEIKVPGLTKETGAEGAKVSAVSKTSEAEKNSETGAATPAQSKESYSSEDMMTAEVLERYPNGNVKLRGVKRIPFKRQVRNIEVLSIVKGSDISEDDIVKSSKFFDQKVELYR